MFVSLEIRWFYGGRFPSALFEWFRDSLPGPRLADADRREDVYLYQPAYEEFGIKLRRRKPTLPYSMEVKWCESARPYDGPHGVSGQVERWRKWGWQDAHGPQQQDVAPLRTPRGPWLTVAKQRWQRKYARTTRGFSPVDNDKFPEVGAAVEVTALKLYEEPFFSVLVEAFAPTRVRQERVLGEAIDELWQEYPGPVLTRARSYGYPFWLGRYGAALAPSVPAPKVQV